MYAVPKKKKAVKQNVRQQTPLLISESFECHITALKIILIQTGIIYQSATWCAEEIIYLLGMIDVY